MRIFILFPLLLTGLTACNSTNKVTTEVPINGLEKLITQEANSDASAITDVINLQDDINALFNSTNPVEVEPDDNIQDVINRAEGS